MYLILQSSAPYFFHSLACLTIVVFVLLSFLMMDRKIFLDLYIYIYICVTLHQYMSETEELSRACMHV